ncbi:MAG: extracellular solute-binding protein [Clostridia bacterium]|nr:extracellular solute-binding protein [Clostridia bacterium]
MKKHPFAALTALLLTAAVTAPTLTGCGTSALLSETGRTESPLTTGVVGELPVLTTPSYYVAEDPETDETYTPEYQLQLLAKRDFEEGIFLTVQEEGLDNAIFPSDEDLINVYADRRNRLIAEKYNVEFACITKTADEIVSELSAAKKNNSYFADLLIVSPSLFKQLKSQGLLQALDPLPFFEIDSVCIRSDATTEINSKWSGIYGIWGDALRQPGRAYAVYYNTAQAAAMECPNLYQKVIDGTWDLNTLLEFAEDGKLVFDGDADDLLLSLSGINSATEEGKALLASEEFAALVAAFEACRYVPEEESVTDAFLSGKTLFYIGTLGELTDLSQAELTCGLLPMPKYDGSAEDYPYLTDQSELPILACPINVTSTEGTGIMLSALNAASCDEVEEIFLQTAETHVRDNGSFQMLPYCIGTLTFDRKLIFGE